MLLLMSIMNWLQSAKTPDLILINCLRYLIITLSSYLAPCVLSVLVFHIILNHFNFKIRAKWEYCHYFCSYYARCCKWQWSLKKLLFQTKKYARNAKKFLSSKSTEKQKQKKITKRQQKHEPDTIIMFIQCYYCMADCKWMSKHQTTHDMSIHHKWMTTENGSISSESLFLMS